MANKKRVGIVGAGPSGLTSAKYALEYGLEPVVFEKLGQISGQWNAKNTAIWTGMRSNTTRFLSRFSDHPWPKDTRLYPFASEVDQYLQSYAKKFNLTEHIRVHHKVVSVKLLENQSWEVRYENLKTKEKGLEVFDFLIIASGAYQSPSMPEDENMSSFKGLIMHSSQFRLNDSRLKSKNVIVVGGSISGCDISGQLSGHADCVYHVFRRTPVILPIHVKVKVGASTYSIVPWESLIFTRATYYVPEGMSQRDFKIRNRMTLKKIAAFQADKNPACPDSLRIDFLENLDDEISVGLSDSYIDAVKDKKIIPIKSSIQKYFENGVLLENDEYIQVHAVIYCTGYQLAAAEYLDKSILEKMKYRDDVRMSLLLYKETFVPDIKNLAYIGLNHGACFPGYEMQSKWANAVFAGKIDFPDRAKMEEFIRNQEMKRSADKERQYPYGGYPLLVDNYAEEIGLKPDLNWLKQHDKDLYEILWNDCIYWSHFLYDKQDQQYFRHMLKETHEMKSKIYEIKCDDEHDIRQADVINEFNKNYF